MQYYEKRYAWPSTRGGSKCLKEPPVLATFVLALSLNYRKSGNFDGNKFLWLAESTKIKNMKNNAQQNLETRFAC